MSRNIIPQLNDVEKETMGKLLNNRNLTHVQAPSTPARGHIPYIFTKGGKNQPLPRVIF
jgi:hypothetical protein